MFLTLSSAPNLPNSNQIRFLSSQIETLYKKCHANIRANPAHGKKAAKKITKKRWNKAKQTLQQRKDYVSKRKSDYLAKLAAESEA